MAKIILGIGTSHSPLLTVPGSEWHNRASADKQNPNLTLADGRSLSYDELVAERGEKYADIATPDIFVELSENCQAELDNLKQVIEDAKPDVVVIVGDDQDEFYSPGNMPSIAVFWGETVTMHNHPVEQLPDWMKTMAQGYAMDAQHKFPGHPQLALEIINGLMERGVDLAVCKDVPDPEKAGFGHAYGFPVKRLFGGREIPIIPIMLNTYFPPNVPTARRCFDIGQKLRDTIEGGDSDLRVAVLASGGLSHFVVEEELDRQVLGGLADPNGEALRAIPREALLEGSSEILNWVLTAGAVSHLTLQSANYVPVRRTPAGSGVGLGFAVWS